MNTLFNQMLSALEDVKNGNMEGVGFLQTAIVALDNLNDIVFEHVNAMPNSVQMLLDKKTEGKFGQMARIAHAFACDCEDAQKMREDYLTEVNNEMGKQTSDEGIVEMLESIFGKDNVKVMVTSLDELIKSNPKDFAEKFFGENKPKFH
ncbi:TPA: hypothetical protein NNT57_004635 [Salmonella enterica]|uniref:Uncharacterized protein n=2 Tax=Lokivirus IMEAB3 TaxID=2560266 RepID=A0A481S1Z3_9CAUD|nr:hypothetical protein CH11_gp54 [Acinetobacter phage IMEAB3]AHI60053.1 hypothetical protein IME_AB3_54 [Acinetobacter phage IMEAB3]QBG78712.1 hypothetical protein vBAbaSD0_18 [Acinetobacter phage vB_AbaS_D0]HCH8772101.1 hypothetical protein [Salmonella enterica]HCH9143091.1 hypothetical protein [Salmonella enterica]